MRPARKEARMFTSPSTYSLEGAFEGEIVMPDSQ